MWSPAKFCLSVILRDLTAPSFPAPTAAIHFLQAPYFIFFFFFTPLSVYSLFPFEASHFFFSFSPYPFAPLFLYANHSSPRSAHPLISLFLSRTLTISPDPISTIFSWSFPSGYTSLFILFAPLLLLLWLCSNRRRCRQKKKLSHFKYRPSWKFKLHLSTVLLPLSPSSSLPLSALAAPAVT